MQPAAEEDGGVESPAAYGEAYSGEWRRGREGGEEDVAYGGRVGVGAVEEAGSGSRGVEGGEVGGCPFFDWFWEFVAEGGGWGVGFYVFGGWDGRC